MTKPCSSSQNEWVDVCYQFFTFKDFLIPQILLELPIQIQRLIRTPTFANFKRKIIINTQRSYHHLSNLVPSILTPKLLLALIPSCFIFPASTLSFWTFLKASNWDLDMNSSLTWEELACNLWALWEAFAACSSANGSYPEERGRVSPERMSSRRRSCACDGKMWSVERLGNEKEEDGKR